MGFLLSRQYRLKLSVVVGTQADISRMMYLPLGLVVMCVVLM
jgi:hypothetical protein